MKIKQETDKSVFEIKYSEILEGWVIKASETVEIYNSKDSLSAQMAFGASCRPTLLDLYYLVGLPTDIHVAR